MLLYTDESVALEAHAGYRHGAPGGRRIVLRHVPDPSERRRRLPVKLAVLVAGGLATGWRRCG